MKKSSFKYQIAAGVTLIIIGTLALLSDYIKEKRDVVFSEMNLTLSASFYENEINDEDESSEVVDNIDNSNDTKVEEDNSNYTYEEYLGILEIPKIGFYKGFYKKDSNLNNVQFNLYVHPVSDYPDVNNGNLIIAGHSGNYNNSYFANLYQLVNDDVIIIHYGNLKYTYKIVNIYNEKKTGTIRIFRNKEKSVVTLITCTKDDEYHQTIYIAELVSVE